MGCNTRLSTGPGADDKRITRTHSAAVNLDGIHSLETRFFNPARVTDAGKTYAYRPLTSN